MALKDREGALRGQEALRLSASRPLRPRKSQTNPMPCCGGSPRGRVNCTAERKGTSVPRACYCGASHCRAPCLRAAPLWRGQRSVPQMTMPRSWVSLASHRSPSSSPVPSRSSRSRGDAETRVGPGHHGHLEGWQAAGGRDTPVAPSQSALHPAALPSPAHLCNPTKMLPFRRRSGSSPARTGGDTRTVPSVAA